MRNFITTRLLPHRQARRSRAGFALLLTLFVLALSLTILAGFARHSMNVAWQAQDRETELQHKWAVASLQWCLLDEPEKWLYPQAGNESKNKIEATTSLKWIVRLGQWDFACTLADESTRADLGVVLNLGGEADCLDVADSLGEGGLKTVLRPLKTESRPGGSTLPRLRIWAQVFDVEENGPESGLAILNQTGSLTLWGGPMNVSRTSPKVLESCIKPVCGSIVASRVSDLAGADEHYSAGQIIAQVSSNDRQRAQLSALIGDKSTAFGLSIVGSTGRKQTVGLTVKKYFASSLFRVYSFQW